MCMCQCSILKCHWESATMCMCQCSILKCHWESATMCLCQCSNPSSIPLCIAQHLPRESSGKFELPPGHWSVA